MQYGSTEGILFGDLFINNREMFVKLFEQYYIENQAIIAPVINNLQIVLEKYNTKKVTSAMASEFHTAWSRFQQIVLLNQKELQLIVAYRGQSGRDGQFSEILYQSEVEESVSGVYGINAGNQLVRDSIAAIKASEVEAFLQNHLNGFLHQLELPITQNEAEKIHKYHSQFLANKDIKISGSKWREPFYGTNSGHFFGGQGLGQAYDAFMNHLANHNKQVYNYLASGGRSSDGTNLKTIETGSVFQEEKGVTKQGTFPKLLNESKNHIGWYTGGDIIIVNPSTMEIVYNIQLKTTTENKASVFAEKVSAIRAFINSLQNLTPHQKGERLFDFLLTSVSNRADFNRLLNWLFQFIWKSVHLMLVCR